MMWAIDLFLALFVVPVVALAWMARKRGRLWSGAWLLTIAPLFMPLGEDGLLAVWYALAAPELDPHGIRGRVHPHALGHVLGAGIAAILLGLVAAYIARRHLAFGARWAYRTLAFIGIPVVLVGLIELLLYFGHGLPTPAAEGGGFGWPFWVAGILAWTLGLALAWPAWGPSAER